MGHGKAARGSFLFGVAVVGALCPAGLAYGMESIPGTLTPFPYTAPGAPATSVDTLPGRVSGLQSPGGVQTIPGSFSSVQATPLSIAFDVVYNDGASEGFNDPTLGSQRRGAFESALSIWSGHLLRRYAGETITVTASFDPLGGSPGGATLGQAGSTNHRANFGSINANPNYRANTFFGEPLANHLRGADLVAGSPEIQAQFNSDVDNSTVVGTTDWYYGENPAGIGDDVDFRTVVLHEVGHGLNFTDLINENTGALAQVPGIYDRNLILGATGGTALVDMSDADRKAALTSGNLYWSGPVAMAANGGARAQIFAPNPFQPGSSVSHLDEGTYGNELMSPYYSSLDRSVSNLELGMLADMGWDINAVPEPTSAAMLGLGLGTLALTRRRRARAGA